MYRLKSGVEIGRDPVIRLHVHALRIARLLHHANYPVLLTSRKGGVVPVPFKAVKFDWYDPSTFEGVFATDPSIDRIYLLSPGGSVNVFSPMKPFIDLAVQRGVEWFVLLSGSMLDSGQQASGKVHEYLLSLKVDYAVIRPSWFFENFLTIHLGTIRKQNTIMSASGDGRIGFISADDIADLVVSALSDEKSHNTDHILLGPELLTYDDVADIFTEVLGRKITHTRVSVEELKKRYISFGLPEDFSVMLSSLDGENDKGGGEEETFMSVKKVSGKRALRSFVEANRNSWLS
ncbi:uncharacterized protein EV420DRAFT_1480652 [Desarmillaria tabescens]|uniref:NmrA-like domain-containing protein n=1 Tax=Armillaria tabescens TaxID=1929756 RepID=A0AA39N4H1_ARMTA|nr:uncharacterized protein EV420DRAFT_1480652 [Desarmillaria tabescens]KAK0457592.1 hypothetical protein EV420DRAFT_1480652 [Desarmillaria tabescens]